MDGALAESIQKAFEFLLRGQKSVSYHRSVTVGCPVTELPSYARGSFPRFGELKRGVKTGPDLF